MDSLALHPYHIAEAAARLPRATGEERRRLVRILAAGIGDEESLRLLIGTLPEELRGFYPDNGPETPDTNDTINSFISRFSSEKKAAAPTVEQLVCTPTDYAATLAPDTPPADADLSSLADLSTVEEHDTRHDTQPPEDTRTLSDTETLRTLIREGDYLKAISIITELNLNNPKKSIYFAHQIRFLKKLQANRDKLGVQTR